MEMKSREEVLLATGRIGYLFRKFGIPGIVGLLLSMSGWLMAQNVVKTPQGARLEKVLVVRL